MDSDDEIPTLIEHPTEQSGDLLPKDAGLQPAADVSRKTPGVRVPLTIICGFLGAGKSTLLKRILTERHGYRIAVIMNEFGDTADIESRAINVSSENDPTAENTEEVLELPNGCLCCSIKDTGAAAIEKLMKRKGAFDHILLETTGLADPGPIASMFWVNEEYAMGLGQDIMLDGVLCVVDAVFGKQYAWHGYDRAIILESFHVHPSLTTDERFLFTSCILSPQQMEEDQKVDTIGESLRQIAGSDVIILNKTDLVTSPSLISKTEALIHQINPAAPIYRSTQGQIDLKHIIGINAYGKPQVELGSEGVEGGKGIAKKPIPSASVLSSVQQERHDEHNHDHDHEHGHDHSHSDNPPSTHYELRGISSLQVTCPILTQSLLNRLDTWIRLVLWENRLPTPHELDNTDGVIGNLGSLSDALKEIDTNTSVTASLEPEIQVLRCKGLFLLDNGAKYILQGVRNIYEISSLEESGDQKGGQEDVSVPQMGKIVLIGKGLDARVRTSLESILSNGGSSN